jgi:hypothetical protein
VANGGADLSRSGPVFLSAHSSAAISGRQQIGAAGIIGAGVVFLAFLGGQLLVGTSLQVAVLFSVAILFGVLSVIMAGGIRTAFGLLNFILIGKYLLFALTMKILTGEPSERNLYAPENTALVMAVGFIALFAGMAIQRALPHFTQLAPKDFPDRFLIVFALLLFALGCGGAVYDVLVRLDSGIVIKSGGLIGIARQFGALSAFSLVPAMMYLWRVGTKRYLTHPLILVMMAACSLTGVFGAQKQQAMEPVMYAMLMVWARYGLRSRQLVATVAAGMLLYFGFVYPYSQYARGHGARTGDADQRMLAISQMVPRLLFDSEFRNEVNFEIRAGETQCWDEKALIPFTRFHMACEADRLIAATDQLGSYTEWQTITWGFKLLMPSFLYPEKPVYGTGNFLAHITGQVASVDQATQVSFGLMANFYNAFRLTGVFFGTLAFFTIAYYWLSLFCGNPTWLGKPTPGTMFFILIVGAYQHALPESPFASLVPSLVVVPILVSIVFFAAHIISLRPTIFIRKDRRAVPPGARGSFRQSGGGNLNFR